MTKRWTETRVDRRLAYRPKRRDDMNRRIAVMVVVIFLWVGAGIFWPEQSPAQFCQDRLVCSSVESLGPWGDLVLCQYFRASSEVSQGHVDYAYCRSTGDPRSWECDRNMPKGLSKVWLTETEWADDSIRCAKLCGRCPSGWKAASPP